MTPWESWKPTPSSLRKESTYTTTLRLEPASGSAFRFTRVSGRLSTTFTTEVFPSLLRIPVRALKTTDGWTWTGPVALLVGAELDGVSAEGLALADETIEIPMAGMVRSLNVSVASALLLFEAFRQRQERGMYGASRLPEREFRTLLFEWCYPEIAEVLRRKGEPFPGLSPEGEILP